MSARAKRAEVLAILDEAIFEAELVDGLFAITYVELAARAVEFDKARGKKVSKIEQAAFITGWRRCEAGATRIYHAPGYDACVEHRRARARRGVRSLSGRRGTAAWSWSTTAACCEQCARKLRLGR